MEPGELGCTDSVKCEIRIVSNGPFKERFQRIPPPMVDEVHAHMKEMLVLCKVVLTVVHNCYLFLYMKCLGGLHYNSLYALSLHSTLAHLQVHFLCMLGRIRQQAHVI